MDLKPGSRWKSAVCDVEVVIVRPPNLPAALKCGGHPMIPHAAQKPAGLVLSPSQASSVQAGKRLTDAASALEVLCTKGGEGSLSIDDRILTLKQTKVLPSSD